MRVNGTLVEDKMRRFKGECEHFRFNKCPIYTDDGASAKFSTNSQEMDNSVYNTKRNGKFGTGFHGLLTVMRSVADPDPGIRCLFDPWIRDPGWVESQHPDPG